MNLSTADNQASTRFQSGLLHWLRSSGTTEDSTGSVASDGLREMIAVLRGLAEEDSGNALLWRSSEAFLKALLDGSLRTDEEARHLCRRIERHLSRRIEDATSLGDAIFAYVSNRQSRIPPKPEASATSQNPSDSSASTSNTSGISGLNQALRGTLNVAADILPFVDNKTFKFSATQHDRWQRIARQIDEDWHAMLTGEKTSCRSSTTDLVALALELHDAASLRLAEAIADAGSALEDKTLLTFAPIRAAFAAALEIVGAKDGPEQQAFDDKSRQFAQRLAQTMAQAKSQSTSHTTYQPLMQASAPWFAEEAHEWLEDMRNALDAVPPKRLTLVSGFNWLARQESANGMALRGLATLAGKVVQQMRSEDMDAPEKHHCLSQILAALSTAVIKLADGQIPQPDEAAFSALHDIENELASQRKHTTDESEEAPPLTSPANTTPQSPGF